jgi:hypothetical protein
VGRYLKEYEALREKIACHKKSLRKTGTMPRIIEQKEK